MYDFAYLKPATLEEAVKALAEEEAMPISGGQTLIPTLKQRLAMPSTLVDLSVLDDLKGVEEAGDGVLIKGATTHAAISDSPLVKARIPALAELAAHIGDPQVRHRGTIGGSVANNDPAACYPAAVLGLGATVLTDRREIAAEDFFLGIFTTALDEGEIVTGVRFPAPQAANYQKFVQPASRFALVGVFAARMADGPRVAVTGASEGGVFRWSEAEAALAGDWSPAALDAVDAPPAAGMMSDIHGSAEYRAHLVKVLTRRAVAAAG
jgi:carbon-monoxide dehydrogenase medium subunit